MVPFRDITPAVQGGLRDGLTQAIAASAMQKPSGEPVPLVGHTGSNILGLE